MALVSSLAKGLRKTPRESLDPIGPPAPTDYTGTLPSTVAELNGWTLASIWDFAHNFKDITGSPNTVNAMTGSSSFQLTRLGGSQATVIAAPQSGYADQAGITIATSSQTLYRASSSWSHHATIPTVYLCTFRFESAPVTKSPKFLGGLAGDGVNGFYVQAHATSGIRVGIGNGTSGFVNTSYIGGTDFYDGEWHTLALCIDDAAGKVKLACGAYSTESTGLTIYAPVAIYCTVGATYDGDPDWEPSVSYLLIARGQHPLAYTNFETALDEYEDARLNNVNQTAIAGLPTTLAELNAASGLTFTHAWNLGSATSNPPVTGSSGVTLAPNTGTLIYGGTGTAPTLATAPQVRTSFTSQAAITNNSSKDNMQGSDLWPDSNFTAIIVSKCNWSTNPEIAQFRRSTAGQRGWRLLTDGSNVSLYCYSSSPTATSHSIQIPTTWATAYNLISFRVPSAGAQSRLCSGYRTPSNSGANQAALGTASTSNPTIGAESQDAALDTSVAFVGYLAGQVADAAMDAAHQAIQWRYGL